VDAVGLVEYHGIMRVSPMPIMWDPSVWTIMALFLNFVGITVEYLGIVVYFSIVGMDYPTARDGNLQDHNNCVLSGP
jgi:hypothetical protein